MRLLYLTDRLSDRGGADQHLTQVVADVGRAGHHVSVAFGRDGGGMEEIRDVDLLHIKGLASRVDSSSGLADLSQALDRADVVHIQNVMNPTAIEMAVERGRAVVTVQDHRVFCPGPGKTMPGGSVCVTAMDESVCCTCLGDESYLRSTMDLTRRRRDAIGGAELVVLSRYMARELAVVGLEGARVIPPWIEAAGRRSDGGSKLIMGGRLVAHKAVQDGWRAWCEAGRPLPLVVAGSGPLESELHGARKLGWLAQKALVAELRSSRALLFPARWQEPFGILGLEALAQGTPVVVAESGGTPDWSAHGCVTVPPGDVRAMAAAIEDLASDPGRALALGRAGQAAVRDRFAREPIVRRLRDLYEEVAAA